MDRFNLGPVFLWEWRRVSRLWWFYALRSALVGGLLLGLGAVWWMQMLRPGADVPREMARLGEWFFKVIVVAQLSMVLLTAPAVTAGAFGTDRVRGHVSLMLVTELTSLDSIFGSLVARLLPVLAGVLSLVPVLALVAHLGGIPPEALVDLVVVTVASALLVCSLALVVSIAARRFHEVLVATYFLLVAWVLGYPTLFMIRMTAVGVLVPGWWMHWLLDVNPYWLALGPVIDANASHSGAVWSFLGGTVALSALLLAGAAWMLRTAAMRDQDQAALPRWSQFFDVGRSRSSLDSHPVFWRECRRQQPSTWIVLLWGFYVAGAVLFSALAAGECSIGGVRRSPWTGPFNGFQAAVGLILMSLVTPASLAEDRVAGSLGVLLSTPLSTRELVLGKWLAHYRVVPWLALLPGIVALAHAAPTGRWLGVVLVIGTVMAQGAAVTSLGIALATWVSRLDLALTLSSAVAVFVTVAWVPLMLVLCSPDENLALGLASASPLLGVGVLTTELVTASARTWPLRVGWAVFWILVYAIIALTLCGATVATFDSCVGRITSWPARRNRSQFSKQQ
jgi:hypothetical protein